jgi:hypothetical protein
VASNSDPKQKWQQMREEVGKEEDMRKSQSFKSQVTSIFAVLFFLFVFDQSA